MTQDLNRVPTERLLPGYEHVHFPVAEHKRYQQMVATGEIMPVAPLRRVGSTYFTTIHRPPQHREVTERRWVRPLAGLLLVAGGAVGFIVLVVWAVRALLSEVAGVLPGADALLGFLVAVSVLLFLGTLATRRGGGRTIKGTFEGTIR